jgi:hypothetical protein
MTARQTDATVAPALKALGGWTDAPWFSPSILSDSEVVGFQFPPLPGIRKQNFEITDRSKSKEPAPRKAEKAPTKPPKRIAGKLSYLLDTFGATRAVACSRSRFLFEASPTLFFAEMPVPKLKATAANKLRRGLIENGLGGCVVKADGNSVMLMFWPTGDESITEFVQTAEPEFPIHLDFFKTAPARRERGARGKSDTKPRSTATASDSEKKLLREVSALRQQVEKLRQSQTEIGAIQKLGIDDTRLKSMLTLLHPDKHGGSEAANEAAKWINGLREMLKIKQN